MPIWQRDGRMNGHGFFTGAEGLIGGWTGGRADGWGNRVALQDGVSAILLGRIWWKDLFGSIP
jgi:hypothetical protein